MSEEVECAAVEARKELIKDLYAAVGLVPADPPSTDGSEETLFDAWSMLEGVVAEYTDGGDEMAEGCTCGQHHHHPDGIVTFKLKYREWRARHGMRS